MNKSGLADNSYLDDGTGFGPVNRITAISSYKKKHKKAMSSEFDDTKLNLFS